MNMSEIAELLERYRRGAELVAVATMGAAGPQLDFIPAPGAWSARQIVCHLADAEMIGAVRFRRVIAEDNPALDAYDQEAWAARLPYRDRKISRALELFRKVRAENFNLLKALPEDTFSHTGIHAELGTITLRDLVQLYAEHAEKHARQIQETRARYRASQSGN